MLDGVEDDAGPELIAQVVAQPNELASVVDPERDGPSQLFSGSDVCFTRPLIPFSHMMDSAQAKRRTPAMSRPTRGSAPGCVQRRRRFQRQFGRSRYVLWRVPAR